MKRKLMSIILTFLLAQPVFCFADSFASDAGFEDEMPLSIFNEDGTKSTSTIDMKMLLTKDINLEKGKKVEVLNNCVFKDTNEKKNKYDISSALVSVICDQVGTFKAYISSTGDDVDTIKSNNGEISFFVPNDETFSLSLKSKLESMSCNIGVLGLGINSTAEEGFPMTWTCENSNPSSETTASSSGSIISSITKGLVFIASMLFGLF